MSDIAIGIRFPGNEFKFDREGLDIWLDAVNSTGFDHIVVTDHIFGVDPSAASPGWADAFPGYKLGYQPYTYRDVFPEPMVLLSYMAARCDLELATGILVLPQRETALLAKQAAEVNRLARGNLRLGVGAGWNRGEFDALGAEFKNRGRRLDEQINLLRLLWTEEVVTFSGDFHTISGCGVGGSPSQPLIPIWVGATTDRALERVGRLADGCFLSASVQPDDEFQRIVSLVRNVAETAGRDPSAIGFEARVLVGGSSDNDIIEAGKAVESWRGAGASHVWLETRYAELRNIDDLDALIRRAGELLR